MNAKEYKEIEIAFIAKYAHHWVATEFQKDLKEVSIAFYQYKLKKSGYAYFDGQLFPIGTKLTSKENGELIPADKETPDELIVGTVK